MPEESEEARWEREFATLDSAELEARVQMLIEAIDLAAAPEFEWRFAAGQGIYVGEKGSKYEVVEEDLEKITMVQVSPSGMYRIALPESECPDLYDLHRKKLWLVEELADRRAGAKKRARD